MEDFKVYRTNWIPGLGHAFAIITFERENPMYPATERFVVVPNDLHFEFQRWEYNGITPDLMSDDAVRQHQREALDGATVEFLYRNREKLKPFFYEIITSVAWHEVDRSWLIQYNLRNSHPGNLAPALNRIRENTECVVLQDFLGQFRLKKFRDCSFRAKPGVSGDQNADAAELAEVAS